MGEIDELHALNNPPIPTASDGAVSREAPAYPASSRQNGAVKRDWQLAVGQEPSGVQIQRAAGVPEYGAH